MKEMTFNQFCEYYCDGLYDSRLSEDAQCTGYLELKLLVLSGDSPASLEEMSRWEKFPNSQELLSKPAKKYLRFLHPLLRPLIIDNWESIKTLPINKSREKY